MSFFVTITYENLPKYCSVYKVIGRDEQNCRSWGIWSQYPTRKGGGYNQRREGDMGVHLIGMTILERDQIKKAFNISEIVSNIGTKAPTLREIYKYQVTTVYNKQNNSNKK